MEPSLLKADDLLRSDEISGKVADLAEYIVVEPWRGKILLLNGFTRAPDPAFPAEQHWRFESGPQILDMLEANAVNTIRRQLSQSNTGR